ncbi:MAG TPA: DUF2071 domain-containing protein [Verrucomicrobiae bacterium]|nr:DUF2071 domain-containing protein [Verrucomicrobiae bacterium]
MKLGIPAIHGTIDRRILVNFRVAPETLQCILPEPFRVKKVRGWGIGGICLIRLKAMRPRFVPAGFGFDSENAAHRIAVEWDQNGVRREGVFIPRRDTSARFQTWIGGRIFPGVHHLADFEVDERGDDFRVEMRSRDGSAQVFVEARRANNLPATSIFQSLSEASEFFQRGSLGFSSTPVRDRFEGLELHSHRWEVTPLSVERVKSSFFDDETHFPEGTVEFDSALLMRGIDHEWIGRGTMNGNCDCGTTV